MCRTEDVRKYIEPDKIRKAEKEDIEPDKIRKAEKEDIPALMKIYNEAILHTVATFDMEVKDLEDRKKWFNEHTEKYVIFVWEEDGMIKGYSSLSRYRDRKAFDGTVEISVYIGEAWRGKGIGKALMQRALGFAEEHPEICEVVSLITGENAGSIHLHEELGFVYCGQFRNVGQKFGKMLDLNFYQYAPEGI